MGNVAGRAGACSPDAMAQPEEGLVQQDAHSTGESTAWFALIIHQYKRELCEQLLDAMGFEYFSPCFTEVREWSDRFKRVDVPLFPGYIFCRFHPRKRLVLLQIPGILGIVSSGRQLLEVDQAEIEGIRTAVANRMRVEPYPQILRGRKVTVMDGPLRGIQGLMLCSANESRFLLTVTILNRCVSVELKAGQFPAAGPLTSHLA